MLRLLAVSLLVSLLTLVINAQDRSLQLGTPVEGKLGPNETDVFTVTLGENQFAQIVVDQRGIDVVVRVGGPGGKSLGEFDSPNGDNGPENVSIIATAAGAYRIFVSPLTPDSPVSGAYEIKLVELRQATEQELKTSKNLEVVKAKGLALFSEIEGLIPEIHTRQTRLRAQMKAAEILWDIDPKRSAKYTNDAIAGVKEFLALDASADEYTRDYSAINELRYEIMRGLAMRDPETALSFLYATRGAPNPYGSDREQTQQEQNIELLIANQMLAKDPKRALAIARQNLKSGYSPDLMNTISMLRQKNSEVAAEFAAEVANKVLNEKLVKNSQAGLLTAGLITTCNARPARTQGLSSPGAGAEPLLTDQTCRDLLRKAFDEALSFPVAPNSPYTAERDSAWNLLNSLRSMGQDLDANVEGGAAAVEKKWNELNNTNPEQKRSQQLQEKLNNGTVEGALESIQKAPDDQRDQLYQQLANSLANKGEGARARQILNDSAMNPFQRRQALANVDQQELYQQIARGKIDDALRTIAALKTPRERGNLLMQIVRQIGPGQKRANAINFLEQARTLLATGVQAQDQEQMYALIELARAFSRYDVKRAFEILDPLVDQVNDLCAAAHVLDGFGTDFYENDELVLQNGNTVSNVAMVTTNVLGTLAIINFERAKQTSDRLRLPELRLQAYLDIAEQTIQASKSESITQRGVNE